MHDYACYECRDGDGRQGEQKIIAGGGGAYLAPTYHLPPSLSLPPSGSSQYNEARVRTYHLAGDDDAGGAACYPTAAQAKGLRWGVFTMGLRNGPGFAALVGAAYAVWAYTLLREGDRAWGWPEMAARLVAPWAPLLVLIVVGLALLGFTHERRPSRKWPARGLALGHLAVHAVVIVTLAWALERAWAAVVDDEPFSIKYRLGVALLVGLVGALIGPVVLALYLLVADRWRGSTPTSCSWPSASRTGSASCACTSTPTATSRSTRSPSTASPGGGVPSMRPRPAGALAGAGPADRYQAHRAAHRRDPRPRRDPRDRPPTDPSPTSRPTRDRALHHRHTEPHDRPRPVDVVMLKGTQP